MPAKFIEQGSLSHVHPVLESNPSSPIKYQPELGSFATKDGVYALEKLQLWQGAREEKERLFLAMEKYERKASSRHKTGRSALEIRQAQNSWKDILGDVDAAVDRYHNDSKAVNYIRKVRNNLDSMQGWSECLPQGDYSGAIWQVTISRLDPRRVLE